MSKTNLWDARKLISISLGLVYLWFGSLKYVPGLSPAEDLAKNTIDLLTFSLIPSHISIVLLAIWETGIGVLLLINRAYKPVVIIALIHIFLTFTPLFFFPEDSFNIAPFGLTLIGQYIIKNFVFVAAFLFLLKTQDDSHRGEI